MDRFDDVKMFRLLAEYELVLKEEKGIRGRALDFLRNKDLDGLNALTAEFDAIRPRVLDIQTQLLEELRKIDPEAAQAMSEGFNIPLKEVEKPVIKIEPGKKIGVA